MQFIGLLDSYITILVRDVDLPDTVVGALSSSNGMKVSALPSIQGPLLERTVALHPGSQMLGTRPHCASWNLSLAIPTDNYGML